MGRSAATWRGAVPPAPLHPSGWRDWVRVARRGMGAVLVLLVGVAVILPLRLVERLVHGARRPWTGRWVQAVCRGTLAAIGLRCEVQGRALTGPGAVVANHQSWLDILTLHAALPVTFVSKAEVAGWPGINILTTVTDTHFVTRDPKLAAQQAQALAARLAAGHRLAFFPEGTSSDGAQVLPFKPALFQGFLAEGLPEGLAVQPVTIRYHAPPGADARVYGWWGDMDLGPHLLSVLTLRRHGRAVVRLAPPVAVAGQDRKSLARATELAVRAGLRDD